MPQNLVFEQKYTTKFGIWRYFLKKKSKKIFLIFLHVHLYVIFISFQHFRNQIMPNRKNPNRGVLAQSHSIAMHCLLCSPQFMGPKMTNLLGVKSGKSGSAISEFPPLNLVFCVCVLGDRRKEGRRTFEIWFVSRLVDICLLLKSGKWTN